MAVLERVRLPADASSIGAARHWVRAQVAETRVPDPLLRDLELITSEIVTVAVRAGYGAIDLAVTADDFAIRVDVTDQHGEATEQLEDHALDLLVDGIDVVHAVSAEWDWHRNPDGTKTVWALLIRDEL
ncbi:MAG: ATP-binding protein [Jatrophihabitans sp.]|uniref:ATP-binding protein n=1 Tax=Jatrophihabitans sp. TaxID=1932789 RepID=UPI003F7FB7BC